MSRNNIIGILVMIILIPLGILFWLMALPFTLAIDQYKSHLEYIPSLFNWKQYYTHIYIKEN